MTEVPGVEVTCSADASTRTGELHEGMYAPLGLQRRYGSNPSTTADWQLTGLVGIFAPHRGSAPPGEGLAPVGDRLLQLLNHLVVILLERRDDLQHEHGPAGT
jgi:hypothetical protein